MENKIAFYTYTPRGKVPYSLVLKGLSDTIEEREVSEYIKGLQIKVIILNIRKLGGDKWLLGF